MEGRRDALVAAAPFILAGVRGGAGPPVRRRHRRPHRDRSRIDQLDPRAGGVPARRPRARDRPRSTTWSARSRAGFPRRSSPASLETTGAAFDAGLREALHAGAERRGVAAGDLPSYAGHDAGILAPHVPAAMLFVRNPTGASHTPAESASDDDCVAAAQVLADALEARLTAG